MDSIDAVVVGAGVVGLAVGRALAQRGLDTVVLERADAIGTATSSRNSEVIHAGLYYPTGTWKARLCVRGRGMLYAYCASHGVAHSRCGKLLVAQGLQQGVRLEVIAAQAARNGVDDLQPLDDAQLHALEPALRADRALLSPSTGIVDTHGLMLALRGDLESAGGAVALRSAAERIHLGDARHVVEVGGADPMSLAARVVVNAAGLWAPSVASRMDGLAAVHVPGAHFAKGNYFALAGRSPFSRLIYPMPEEGGLGVHLTLDLAGQARFGPDVEWISPATPDDIDYRVDASRSDAFVRAIRSYWPQLPHGALQPAYSGVRPKLTGPGEPAGDFVLQGQHDHGVQGLVNLFGIESPGITACLALGDSVAEAVGFERLARAV